MVVHQTSQLHTGIMLGGGGLFFFFVCLHECLKNKAILPRTRVPLLYSVYAVMWGAGRISSAYDWPFHDSYRTLLIGMLSVVVVFLSLAWLIFLMRAEKKAKADVGTTASGEHTT